MYCTQGDRQKKKILGLYTKHLKKGFYNNRISFVDSSYIPIIRSLNVSGR